MTSVNVAVSNVGTAWKDLFLDDVRRISAVRNTNANVIAGYLATAKIAILDKKIPSDSFIDNKYLFHYKFSPDGFSSYIWVDILFVKRTMHSPDCTAFLLGIH